MTTSSPEDPQVNLRDEEREKKFLEMLASSGISVSTTTYYPEAMLNPDTSYSTGPSETQAERLSAALLEIAGIAERENVRCADVVATSGTRAVRAILSSAGRRL